MRFHVVKRDGCPLWKKLGLYVLAVLAALILGGVVLLIVISLFVLALSCVLGWVVANISLKLKNKSVVTLLVSLLFLGGY